MQEYLHREVDRSLSSSDIQELTNGKCNIMEYGKLAGVRDLNEVMSYEMPLVLLYETSQDYGHWCCVLDHGDSYEFFDSYGTHPDGELLWVPKETRAELGESVPYLTRLLRGVPVIYNNVTLQNKKSATCGRWVSARINMRNIPVGEFATAFAMSAHPDAAVVLFTPLLGHPPPSRMYLSRPLELPPH